MPARTERRVVTVLFADLVGFTTLAEHLDAEDVALVQDNYFAGARAAITEAGGEVEKFIGDAVMAAFGVPRVHDDDAQRAVRAALAIIDVVAAVERNLGLPHHTLQVRVGVNTGEVVVVCDDDGPGTWRLAGDVVNAAARLQTAAEPGSVFVGADTALAVAPAFVTEPAGGLHLKGKTEPVPAWRIREARPTPSRQLALQGLHAATIGREDDLARLEETRLRAAAGRLQAILVVAPPGVGKTRLVAEFRDRARARQGSVWTATVSEPGGTRYEPVADLLRQAVGPDPTREALLDRLRRHGLTGPRAELSVEHTRALLSGTALPADVRIVDLWTSWTAVLDAEPCSAAPVWIVEDVHLASPDLRGFLAHSLAEPHCPGRMLLMTARPVLLVVAREAGFAPAEIMYLEPLPEDSTRRLVEALTGDGVLPPDLAETVVRASGGNPLFVEELLRSWVQGGSLRRTDDGRWELAGAGIVMGTPDPAIPSTVRGIYLGQLEALPPTPRGVVESGSVPGTTFPSGALPVLGVDDPVPALDFLTESGLLAGPHSDVVDPRSYTYRHALLRDAAYGSLPRSRRAQLHTRFADWVASTVAAEQAAEIVGEHLLAAYEEASPLGAPPEGVASRDELGRRAAAWLERAAETSLATAPYRAIELYRTALRLTDPSVDTATAVRRQVRLAEALRRAGQLEEALREFGAAGAVAAAQAPDELDLLATIALGYEDALFESRLPRRDWGAPGVDALHAALAHVPEGTALQARLLAALGRAQVYGGDPAVGARTAAHALETARASGDDGALAYALMAMRAAHSDPRHLRTRLDCGSELIAAAHRAGEAERELEGLRLHFVDLMEAGDISTATAVQQRAESAIEDLRRPLFLWYPAMWRAMQALFRGDFAAAERLIDDFREQGQRWHYRDVELVHAVQLMQLAHDQGGRSGSDVDAVEGLARTFPERVAVSLAAVYARTGRLDDAARQLEPIARGEFAAIPQDQSRSYLLALSADTAAALDDAPAARSLLPLLEPWAEHNVVLGSGAACLGSGSLFLGLAARTAGDPMGAAGHLRSAIAMNDAMGAVPAATRARLELARTLAGLGHADEARSVAHEARGDASRIGMLAVVEQADVLLREAA